MTEEQETLDTESTAVADDEEKSPEQEIKDKLKEAIDVKTEDVGTLRKKLTITVPRDALDERLNEQFTDLKRDAVVPGFRKGHAPLVLVQKRFGTEVGDQILSQLLSSGYLAAVDKVEIKPLGDPMIWVDEGGGQKLVTLEKALGILTLPPEGAFTFSCEVELRPDFDLPELDGIKVEKPKLTISDEDVTGEIDRFRSMRGQYVPVSDGAIQQDDLIVVDLVMKIGDETVRDEKNVSFAARAQLVEGVAIEDFGDKLVGKKIGESVTIEAKVSDDHDNMEYRGKTASLVFAINDIKRFESPPLDKELIETLGFDSEEEMRGQIRDSLVARLDSVVQRGMRGQIGKHLLENTNIEVPEGISQRQTERLVARRMVEMYQSGVPEQEIHKHADELRASASDDSIMELKLFFIMEKIAEEMEIDVSDDQLNGAIANIAAQQGKRFDRVRDELSKGEGLVALYLRLRDDKILDSLLEKAVITEVEGPKKKADKKPAEAKKTAKKKTTGESTEKKPEEKKPKAKKTSKKKAGG